jgi:alkylhydroperoxidase family enzyme
MPTPRLTPIDRPPTLFMRLVFWGLRRVFRKVPTPYLIVFTRIPQALFAHLQIVRVLDAKLTLDPGLRLLVQSHVATLNDCTFCLDIGRAVAVKRHMSLEKVRALPDWRTDARFATRERAALAYVEEATRDRRVADETFAELRRHFDDRQIVEITWLAAVESYFNAINVPLGIGSDGLCAIGTPGDVRAPQTAA